MADLPDMQMPAYRDKVTGEMMVWDPSSHTYVVADSQGHNRPDASHATGGDNDLFDPAVHSEQTKNPLREGILAHGARPCPNCGGLVDEAGTCTSCGYVQHSNEQHLESPSQEHNLGPFPDKVPRPDPLRTDNTFPTMSSRKAFPRSAVRSDMTSFAHVLEENEHLASLPDLDACPKCSHPMTNHTEKAQCHTCGHTQPVLTVESREQRIAKIAYLLPYVPQVN